MYSTVFYVKIGIYSEFSVLHILEIASNETKVDVREGLTLLCHNLQSFFFLFFLCLYWIHISLRVRKWMKVLYFYKMKVLPMNLNLTVKFTLGIYFFGKVLVFPRQEIDLVWGSISHCDNYNFRVAGNTFLRLGKIAICPEGFSTFVLMKEKCDECMRRHDAAIIILNFFCYVIGLCLIIGSYFSILLWGFNFTYCGKEVGYCLHLQHVFFRFRCAEITSYLVIVLFMCCIIL